MWFQNRRAKWRKRNKSVGPSAPSSPPYFNSFLKASPPVTHSSPNSNMQPYHNSLCNNLFLKTLTHQSAPPSDKLNRMLHLNKPGINSWFDNSMRYVQRNPSCYPGRDSPILSNGYRFLDKDPAAWWPIHNATVWTRFHY